MAIIGKEAKDREIEFAHLIPLRVTIKWEGTTRLWLREKPTYASDPSEPQTYTAYLTWRGERQALPRGSSPLKAFGASIRPAFLSF